MQLLSYEYDATPTFLGYGDEILERQPDTGSLPSTPNPRELWEAQLLRERELQLAAEGTSVRSDCGRLIQKFLVEELWRSTAATTQRSGAYPTPAEGHRTIHQAYALTRGVLSRLADVDERRAADARRILEDFRKAADAYDVSEAPDLRLTEAEDGAILIEWTFADRRLGFSLEQQPGDSGWYFVLSNDSSERYEAGTLDQLEMKRLVAMMLTR